jgi:hypothetical protein
VKKWFQSLVGFKCNSCCYVEALGTGIAAHPLSGFDIELDSRGDGGGSGGGGVEGGGEGASSSGGGILGWLRLNRERGGEEGEVVNSGGGGVDSEAASEGSPRSRVGVGEMTLTERTAAGDTQGLELEERWAASAAGWRLMLLRPRRGDSLVAALCVWGGGGGGGGAADAGAGAEGSGGEGAGVSAEGGAGIGSGSGDSIESPQQTPGHRQSPPPLSPPRVRVRWTVPLRGDFAPGEKPPPELLAASSHFLSVAHEEGEQDDDAAA